MIKNNASEDPNPFLVAALGLHKSAHKVMPLTTLNSGPDGCSVNLGFKTYDQAFEFYRLLLKFFSEARPESAEPPFLYRISDGERFVRNEGGFYCMESSMMHDPYAYPYMVLMATGGFSKEEKLVLRRASDGKRFIQSETDSRFYVKENGESPNRFYRYDHLMKKGCSVEEIG